MSSITTNIVAAGAAALLWSATSGSANAAYLGYSNGDPGNWDFYQEQHNGALPPSESAAAPVAPYARPRHHAHIEYRGYMGLGSPRPINQVVRPRADY